MKRCPTCDKEFPDSMRFCQVDGTPLIETAAEIKLPDPYKTIVSNQSGIAETPADPFKTMVAGAPLLPEQDVLDLPKNDDALKTVAVSQAELEEQLKSDNAGKSAASSDDAPAPPKFNEPSLSPPSFGDLSAKEADKPVEESPFSGDATMMMDINPSSEAASHKFDSKPFGDEFSQKSPYGNQENRPIPSPFDLSMPPGGYQPSFEPPKTSIEPLEPLSEPEPPKYDAPPPMNQTPFDSAPPPSPFGQNQNAPYQSAEPNNQPLQQQEWTPPPAPVAAWQEQGVGANTPFQPPAMGTGQDQTLAIVSLVLGIVSFVCSLSIIAAIPAVITGYMQKNNVKNNPAQYGGGTMATIGMILGAVNIALTIIILIIYAVAIAAAFSR